MNTEKPNKEYLITYSNYFRFEDRLFAFRKKQLFDITKIPFHVPYNENAQCWIINRKQLTKKAIKEILIEYSIVVDVSDLQWYHQEQLNHVFNLNK